MATVITTKAPHFIRQARRRGTRSASGAAKAAEQMLHAFEGQTRALRQTLDAHQLQKLSLTLNRTHLHPGLDVSARPPPDGTPLPPGYHLVYFAPAPVEDGLGADGTDAAFNAPAPFSRRMWAGGRMTWSKGLPLRVGEEVEERTSFLGAAAKESRDGTEMVLVDVAKEFWGRDGLALVDRRSWIFRPPPTGVRPSRLPVVVGPHGTLGQKSWSRQLPGDGAPERMHSWSPLALFRFSALTFNAHMIHYNETWAREVEGHPGVVVHGPLNLICMMDYWRDVHGQKTGKEPREISYRALSPVYSGDEYGIRTGSVDAVDSGKSWKIQVSKKPQTICMTGTIEADS